MKGRQASACPTLVSREIWAATLTTTPNRDKKADQTGCCHSETESDASEKRLPVGLGTNSREGKQNPGDGSA